MAILRRHVRTGYTVVPNDILENHHLSWAATGMLNYLLSKPDGWALREAQLAKAKRGRGTGIDAVRAILLELEAAGYVRRGWETSPRGLRRRVTEVSDEPQRDWITQPFGGENVGLADDGQTDDGQTDDGKATALVNTVSVTPEGSSTETDKDTTAPSVRAAIFRWLGYPPDGKGAPHYVFVQVAGLAKLYRGDGEDAVDVDADARRWWEDDWRGRRGEPPAKVSVAQEFRAKVRAGGAVKAAPARPGAHQPSETFTAATSATLTPMRQWLAAGCPGGDFNSWLATTAEVSHAGQ